MSPISWRRRRRRSAPSPSAPRRSPRHGPACARWSPRKGSPPRKFRGADELWTGPAGSPLLHRRRQGSSPPIARWPSGWWTRSRKGAGPQAHLCARPPMGAAGGRRRRSGRQRANPSAPTAWVKNSGQIGWCRTLWLRRSAGHRRRAGATVRILEAAHAVLAEGALTLEDYWVPPQHRALVRSPTAASPRSPRPRARHGAATRLRSSSRARRRDRRLRRAP